VHAAGNSLRDELIGSVVEGNGGLRYHLRTLLGEGGQGWVYKANYDDPDGFWIVVKVLRPECLEGDTLIRFRREAEVMRRLGAMPAPNPNIVRFYDSGAHVALDPTTRENVELPFLVLEYVEGPTLAKVISGHGGFGVPVSRVRRVMKQVARALETIHEQRLVHRDLKPSNILLAQSDGQEIAKVTDFGLVKLPELATNKTVTMAGGSLGYAPPEQYEMGNHRVGPQTDVFSFAAVLFESLSGAEAFPTKASEAPLRVVARMLTGDKPSLVKGSATVPRELRDRPHLTAALDRELGRALSGDPEVRHASVKELWEAIEPLLQEATRMSAITADPTSSSRTGVPPAAVSIPAMSAVSGAPSGVAASSSPSWRVVGRPISGERLRSAVIAPDGSSIVALGDATLLRFEAGVWSSLPLPPGVSARALRGVTRHPLGDLLVYGESGFALLLSPTGRSERVAVDDRSVCLLGALADARGIVLVGERSQGPRGPSIGVVIDAPTGSAPHASAIEGTSRLHGVARLGAKALAVCGAQGALVEIGSSVREIPWGRTGHLFSIASANDRGAFAVGSGGHALRISPPAVLPGIDAPPTATLEAVQTTRDLTNVIVDARGAAWAVGGQARLLARRRGVWTRIALDPMAQAPLVTVASLAAGRILVVSEDGLVLENVRDVDEPKANSSVA
jgi:serine/threonine protein kinase